MQFKDMVKDMGIWWAYRCILFRPGCVSTNRNWCPERALSEREEQMNFTDEMIEKAKEAATAEELQMLAEKEGIELSAADAEMYFSFLAKKNEPLSDEELEQVSGGKGEKPNPQPKYRVGQTVEKDCHPIITMGTITGIDHYSSSDGWVYNVHNYQEIFGYGDIRETSMDIWLALETDDSVKVY